MKYEVIIFDADDTLFDFQKSEVYALEKAITDFDIKYDVNIHLPTYKEINTKIWKEFEEGSITQEKLKVERFKRLSDALELNFDEIKFAKNYMKHLGDASFLFDETTDVIENLHKDCKLTIITNGLTVVQNNRIRKSIIAKYFDDIVISEEIKIAKPDAKIFEHNLSNIKHTDKSKVLMVGDSLTSDIQGGINFGIDTCWYNPKKKENNTNFKPTYEISSLNELVQVIK